MLLALLFLYTYTTAVSQAVNLGGETLTVVDAKYCRWPYLVSYPYGISWIPNPPTVANSAGMGSISSFLPPWSRVSCIKPTVPKSAFGGNLLSLQTCPAMSFNQGVTPDISITVSMCPVSVTDPSTCSATATSCAGNNVVLQQYTCYSSSAGNYYGFLCDPLGNGMGMPTLPWFFIGSGSVYKGTDCEAFKSM